MPILLPLLAEAIHEVERDLHDGDLGGNLLKKRIARAGEGKRGGYRVILVYRKGIRAVFVYGYAKSDKADVSSVELQAYPKLAQLYLRFSETDIAVALQGGELQEIENDDEKVSQ